MKHRRKAGSVFKMNLAKNRDLRIFEFKTERVYKLSNQISGIWNSFSGIPGRQNPGLLEDLYR